MKPEPDLQAPGVLDPKAVPAEAPRDVPAPPPPTEPAATKKEPAWADAPGSAPATAALPRPAEAESPPRRDPIVVPVSTAPGPPEPDARPSGDWAALRRRMHDLGVDRYWIEGEHDGLVRFRCVVSLAGGRAVGQLFEAEGEDCLQAADAALRRVALWKATETP